jgi:hypothetical protein
MQALFPRGSRFIGQRRQIALVQQLQGEGPVSKEADIEQALFAIERARGILRQYIEPGPCDAIATLDQILLVLDDNDLLAALDRIRRRRVIRLVE